MDVSGCRALDGHSAAAADYARTGVQSVLGKHLRGWCYYAARRCLVAGSRVVLSRTAACRYHARALRYLSVCQLDGSIHCAVEPADAFRRDRDHLYCFPPCRLSDWRWHGSFGIWLLGSGRRLCNPGRPQACASLAIFGVAT